MKLNGNYISRAIGRAIEFSAAIPSPVFVDTLGGDGKKTVYSPKEKYPVLYLLHGLGNDMNSWFSYTRAEMYAEENNIAIVTFSAENKFYMNNSAEMWEEFAAEELPALICGYFPVSARAEDTFIAGLSMGGYGALLNGFKHTSRYGAIGSFSGAVERAKYPKELEKEYNIALLLDAALSKNEKIPPLYIACGEDDFIYDNSLRLHEKLEKTGVAHTWESVKGFSHEWRFWDAQLEKFINWLPRTDAYAKVKRKV